MKMFSHKIFIKPLKIVNRRLRRLLAKAHSLQFRFEWQTLPLPEWFDHYIDLYYQWHKKRSHMWLERGCFNSLATKPGGKILELCCGDGFNAYHFYSLRASEVLAVDFDSTVIEHAKNNNQATNITYQTCDIRQQMPQGLFDNIIWDAAIEHFTADEIPKLMEEIKKRLKHDGVLSGYTIVELNQGHGLPQHEIEFASKADLLKFFTPFFKKVKIFETIFADRHNLYFYATNDGCLPFDQQWPNQISNY